MQTTTVTAAFGKPRLGVTMPLFQQFLYQLILTCLPVLMAYKWQGRAYDATFLAESMWLVPLTFLFAQAWYATRALSGRAQQATSVSGDYVAFGTRYAVFCITLTVAIGQIATR